MIMNGLMNLYWAFCHNSTSCSNFSLRSASNILKKKVISAGLKNTPLACEYYWYFSFCRDIGKLFNKSCKINNTHLSKSQCKIQIPSRTRISILMNTSWFKFTTLWEYKSIENSYFRKLRKLRKNRQSQFFCSISKLST